MATKLLENNLSTMHTSSVSAESTKNTHVCIRVNGYNLLTHTDACLSPHARPAGHRRLTTATTGNGTGLWGWSHNTTEWDAELGDRLWVSLSPLPPPQGGLPHSSLTPSLQRPTGGSLYTPHNGSAVRTEASLPCLQLQARAFPTSA